MSNWYFFHFKTYIILVQKNLTKLIIDKKNDKRKTYNTFCSLSNFKANVEIYYVN